jgi:predicted TIM-barrel enzyme
MIIGSYFKKNGNWKNTVEPKRVKQFMTKIKQLRNVS